HGADGAAGGDGHHGDPDRGAAGESEDEGIGERVAQQRLERDARDREGGAHLRGEEHARDAEAEEHRRIGLAALQRGANRKLAGARRETDRGRDHHQRREDGDGEGRARCGGAPHRPSAAERSESASGSRGPGCSRAVERSVATRAFSNPGMGSRPGGAGIPQRTITSGAARTAASALRRKKGSAFTPAAFSPPASSRSSPANPFGPATTSGSSPKTSS